MPVLGIKVRGGSSHAKSVIRRYEGNRGRPGPVVGCPSVTLAPLAAMSICWNPSDCCEPATRRTPDTTSGASSNPAHRNTNWSRTSSLRAKPHFCEQQAGSPGQDNAPPYPSATLRAGSSVEPGTQLDSVLAGPRRDPQSLLLLPLLARAHRHRGRFYGQCMWIPQTFLPTDPDLHHGLLRQSSIYDNQAALQQYSLIVLTGRSRRRCPAPVASSSLHRRQSSY